MDVGDALAPDGPVLLSAGDNLELAVGLPEPLGTPDVGEPDVMLALADGEPLLDVGEVELGTPVLEAVDGVTLGIDRALLRFVDDCVDGLATLEPGVLAPDDVCEG